MNNSLELHGGPDSWGRYTYTLRWDDPSPPWCSTCGGVVTFSAGGVTCAGFPGATPPRPGCGAAGATMPRGQGFHAPLPESERHLKINPNRTLCHKALRDLDWTESPAAVTCRRCLALLRPGA